MLKRKGEQWVKAKEEDRLKGLYGMSIDRVMAEQQAVSMGNQQMWGGIGQMFTGGMQYMAGLGGPINASTISGFPTHVPTTSGGTTYNWPGIDKSDRKLKKDINLTGQSPSGLNIYSFKYKDESFGIGTYQGVMADEIPSYAVISHPDGYDMVDYSKIDVDFIKI